MFIALSGLDGCGKSTHISSLSKHFSSQGTRTKIIWARPGSTSRVLFFKKIARFLFRGLPAPGRSKKREKLIKSSKLGRVWVLISMLDIIFEYAVIARIYHLLGYNVIFDRFYEDSVIDIEIMLGADGCYSKLPIIAFLSNLLPDFNTKFFLKIGVDTSIIRCEQKFEPFPDTNEEKKRRYTIYMNSNLFNEYNGIDAERDSVSVYQDIRRVIDNKESTC